MLKKSGIITGLLVTLLTFIGGCYPAVEGEESATSSPWIMIAFLVIIFAMFYFVMVRPQRKRQKEHESMMKELQKGDKVITAGGIHGTIESVSEDTIVIKVESGATIRFARGSVAARRDKEPTTR